MSWLAIAGSRSAALTHPNPSPKIEIFIQLAVGTSDEAAAGASGEISPHRLVYLTSPDVRKRVLLQIWYRIMQNFTSIPFKTESGLSTVNGIAKFSAAGIVLEFESKLFGVIGGGVKEVRLPIDEILDIKFRKGFMKRGAKIEVRMRSFAKLAELPNSDGKLVLKLERQDFDRSHSAVQQLQKSLSGTGEDLPPPHSPVSELFRDESEVETKELGK